MKYTKKNFFSKGESLLLIKEPGRLLPPPPGWSGRGSGTFLWKKINIALDLSTFPRVRLPNILESCSLSWGHATSLYVMSTSLQIKQTFFPDLPDSKFSYGLTLIWHSLTHGSTISLPLFLPRDYWQWHGLDKEIHLIGFRSRTAHIGLPQPIFAYPGSSASFFQAWILLYICIWWA